MISDLLTACPCLVTRLLIQARSMSPHQLSSSANGIFALSYRAERKREQLNVDLLAMKERRSSHVRAFKRCVVLEAIARWIDLIPTALLLTEQF